MRGEGLPHACGGVSLFLEVKDGSKPSSPRMWGCFCTTIAPRLYEFVFPTHVGVFLFKEPYLTIARCLPHACGGVSIVTIAHAVPVTSSPRMWGCFQVKTVRPSCIAVFPTHVGVFPPRHAACRSHYRLPHACGGVSCTARLVAIPVPSSPRMWGCFQFGRALDEVETVFPTHVGVFLKSCWDSDAHCCLPHACGGVSGVMWRQAA